MSDDPSTKALDALGNPVRRAILEALRAGPQNVAGLAERFPVSRPAVSRHLRLLEEAALVTHERRGREHLYALGGAGFEAAREYLDGLWDVALARFRTAVENLPDEPGERE